MEKELFSWKDWNDCGDLCFSFYEAILKIPIGPYKPGEKFSCIDVNYSIGHIEFYKEKYSLHAEYTAKLRLVVDAE